MTKIILEKITGLQEMAEDLRNELKETTDTFRRTKLKKELKGITNAIKDEEINLEVQRAKDEAHNMTTRTKKTEIYLHWIQKKKKKNITDPKDLNKRGYQAIIFDGFTFSLAASGYYRRGPETDGLPRTLHRYIYQKYNGELIQGLVIDHINGLEYDNRPENLRQVTQFENMQNQQEAPRPGNNIKLEDGREFISVREAAKALDISEQTLHTRIRRGHNKIIGNLAITVDGKTYPNQEKAAEELGIPLHWIRQETRRSNSRDITTADYDPKPKGITIQGLTVKQYAEKVNYSPRHIYNKIRAGEIQPD